MKKPRLTIAATALVAIAGLGTIGLWQYADCEICEAANTILLQGTVAQNCVLNVTADANAAALPLTASGVQRIQVGTVAQRCNKRAGYTLQVTSANCATTPVGGKVIDAVSTEFLDYAAEFSNPTTGGSQASVTGLLDTACTNQIARNVTNAKIANELSTVFVNFTGNDSLAAGTYQDTLTITMNVK